MAEPMRSGNARARLSYAGDIRILGIGQTVLESAAAAQKEVDNLLEWANNNAMSFDPLKSEVVQFPGRRQEDTIGVKFYGTMIEPANHIRWLGVHLDPRLSFKHHMATWCGKALKMAQHMRILNSVKRGADLGPLITAVDASVVPATTFGSKVWWPGMTRPTVSGIVTSQTTHLCSLIDKVLLLALRVALPVRKTTSSAALHREGGIPPARVLLEENRLRLAARLNTLDNRRQLRGRASVYPNVSTKKYKLKARTSKNPETRMTRIQRALRQLPLAEAGILEPLLTPAHSPKLGTKTGEIDSHKS